MKKKNFSPKKLSLGKKTIVVLNGANLSYLQGGTLSFTIQDDTDVATTTPRCIKLKTKNPLDPICFSKEIKGTCPNR